MGKSWSAEANLKDMSNKIDQHQTILLLFYFLHKPAEHHLACYQFEQTAIHWGKGVISLIHFRFPSTALAS